MQQMFTNIQDPTADMEVSNLISPFGSSIGSQTSTIDQRLAQATLQVLETGRLTPLIKEELKCKIQARRHSLGQDEVNVEFKKPKSYLLTAEEKEKVMVRKERNRLAAQRFRQRRKQASVGLESEVERLEAANSRLQDEFESLSVEKKQLLFALQQIRGVQLPVQVQDISSVQENSPKPGTSG